MEDYKLRFIKEHNELKERHGKLTAMINKHHAGTLDFTPTCPIELLERQRDTMADYLLILEERAKLEDIPL